MAGIDYTIPGQFKGIQLEPPENAMARAMQMRALQESSQMNALKQQEYLRGLENRNKLARIYADPKLISGSPEQLARIQQEVPDEYQSAVERALKGEDLKEKIAARKLSETKTQIDIDSQKAAQLKEAQREVTNFESIQDAIDHVNRKLAAGLIDQKHATYMLAQLPKNPLDFGKWKENTLMSMLTAEQQFTQRQKQQDDLYSEYVRSEVLKNPDAVILPKNEFLANIVKRTSTATATAPSDDGATNQLPGNVAFTSANAPNAGGQITVAEDGSKVMPPVEVTGLNLFEPAVANLLATRDSGNVELAKMMEKRLEEERKNKALTGGFLNVYNAEKIIADLEKQEQTPLVKRQIAALREAIKAENLGKGINVNVGVKLPEGVKAVDQQYAKEYLDWVQGGGSDAAANAAQIKSVLDRFAAGEKLSGPSIGLAPDFFNALVNPQALGAKQQIEEVVQRNLRAVLGAQFTQVEGERLIARAFDARLSPQENAKRLRKLFMQIQTAAQQKQAMAEYYQQNETLRGFKGKAPSINDFYNVLTAPETPPKGSVDIKGPDGKTYRFPDQKSADAFKKEHGIKD